MSWWIMCFDLILISMWLCSSWYLDLFQDYGRSYVILGNCVSKIEGWKDVCYVLEVWVLGKLYHILGAYSVQKGYYHRFGQGRGRLRIVWPTSTIEI